MIWRCDLLPQYEAYKDEIQKAINRVLTSGKYILGEELTNFEKEFAEYIECDYAIGVASGTDALILSLLALGIGKGDEVITTPFTAIPTISAIIDTGATPVFVDIDENTFLIDLNKLKKAITKKTKAIIPVHIFGNPVDIFKLKNIAENIPIIEDACQAHGSKLYNKKVGGLGDFGTFSFYPTKNLGAYGDGGIITTNNSEYAHKLKLLRMYGMTDYHHIIINGINSRLDEIQAAILRLKLKYLEQFNLQRNKIANEYISRLNNRFFIHQKINNNCFSNYHVFVSRYLGNRNKLIEYLDKKNIQTNIYYLLPVYLQQANKFLNIKKGQYPVVEKICNEVIALPMYPELKENDLNTIINEINNFCMEDTL
ncbi:MAG TPA: DegT/DnrJ/EryC1/StrS family aminotransferase [Ignavibacteria bacterium]